MALEQFRDFSLAAKRHPLTMAAYTGAGVPGTDPGIIGPHLGSLADVGRHFGVSERTAASWIHAGATTKTDHGYSIPHLEMWRRQQLDDSTTSVAELLTAGLLRAIMHEVSLALAGFVEEIDDPDAAEKLLNFVDSQLKGLLMLDEEFIRGVAAELHGGSFFDRIIDDSGSEVTET